MKLVRIISAFLFYMARILAIGYLISTFHLFVSTAFKLPTLKILEHNRFVVYYPFTEKGFLLGSEYTFSYVTEMVATIGFYGLFFWLLSNVFHTFRQSPLFTKRGIRNLKLFCGINLVVSPVLFGLLSMFSHEDLPFFGMIVAHAIIGIFAYFLTAIFNEGVGLQNEQDLYI
ncbi:DUF2975 domain-containing protein [Flavobacterium humi]|uniref:DUF2975 domain-containing protein n=1 Tax=Flavobacterium humi TaxID=2562683 RepID=A0A4Z0LA22_9FLAO|nr:DUF2975 domain-containing protein [Flavobacterium humi]TGD58920.1 DUF2975 domain-containing protein [Flavobacterium humi]